LTTITRTTNDIVPLTLSDGRALHETLVDRTSLDFEKARIAVAEYRRFLHLAATEPGQMVPSPLLDAIWHLHLIDTRAYAAFCEAAFGRFLHHSPGREAQARDPAYAGTLEAYQRAFGHPPHDRVWPSPAVLRGIGWIGGVMVLGLALLVFGFWGLGPWAIVSGLAMVFVSIVWWMDLGPWRFGNRSDGGCAGGGDGGCGGD